VFVLDDTVVDAFYGSAKTLVTVDPNLAVQDGPGWYKVFTSVTMLVALVFAAAFTAGLVNRVIDRRLTGMVGLRLCLVLRACKIPVVAVERDEEHENVGLAREYGLPVVVGRGADRSLMKRLSLDKAKAVAEVTSDDLANISAAMTARGIHEPVRVVLRVGDGEVANETRSLLALGIVRDVHRIAAALLARMAVGEDAEDVVCLGDDAHIRFPDGRLERAELDTLASPGA
jgi:voltage-gated potassium channel Kch